MNAPANDVLHAHATVEPTERSGEARSVGGSKGQGSPTLPPAPNAGNVDPRVIRDQLAALKRQQRDARKQDIGKRVKSVNRQYWTYAGLGAALVVGMLGCRSYTAQQRDTALALASLAGGGKTEQDATPQTVVVDGIENPLEQLPLTGQARWVIGDDGSGTLPPLRSAIVIGQLLEQVDLCNVFVGLNDKAGIVIADAPAAQFYPLVECDKQPAAALPTTTVAPAPTTTAVVPAS